MKRRAAANKLIRRGRRHTAVAIMLDVGWHTAGERSVSAHKIAGRLLMARRGIEPVLHRLTRAGLLESASGRGGGYTLGKSPRQITLAEVLRALKEEEVGEESPPKAGDSPHVVAVEPLWTGLELSILDYFHSTTLQQLISRAEEKGFERPSNPATYSI
jgi:Rrf2 family transcriptional regulator, iron-sulfur cluster assembly transcription factor